MCLPMVAVISCGNSEDGGGDANVGSHAEVGGGDSDSGVGNVNDVVNIDNVNGFGVDVPGAGNANTDVNDASNDACTCVYYACVAVL
ncbi:hypothetical protein DPMN_055393 [Dreissena polymorpha]|uniref:Uncharacterized protein n=1 Tax=Dreissena polymorpha TaxID=45954 RepID=A0A9D4CQQ3_DREPO|nr:hypothetical protein DPMN_055393 [Dreissena polymorpha]